MEVEELTILETQARIATDEFTAADLVGAYLCRIRKYDPTYNSIIFLNPHAKARSAIVATGAEKCFAPQWSSFFSAVGTISHLSNLAETLRGMLHNGEERCVSLTMAESISDLTTRRGATRYFVACSYAKA